MREYLPTLICRKKWQQEQPPLKVNDLVLIMENNLPRNIWEKGLVTRVLPGKDKHVRIVELREANGHVILRPSNKLVKFA